MRTLASQLLLPVVMLAALTGCSDQASHSSLTSGGKLDGVWASASGTTEVTVRTLSPTEVELRIATVMDRKDRSQDQVRLHVVRLDGSQLLLGATAIGHVDSTGTLVYLGRQLSRSQSPVQ